jgi:HD-GYP domain-containing protein (c-di-GMP phosphodiesterase class II)
VRCHHERWDGHGYPAKMPGEEIPLAARVFAVADAFDAITSDRVYRRGGTIGDARDAIRAGAGSQFDPQVVAAPTGRLRVPAATSASAASAS